MSNELTIAFRSGFEKAAQSVAPIQEGESDTAALDQRMQAFGDAGLDTSVLSPKKLMSLSDTDVTKSLEPLMGNDSDSELVSDLQNQLSATSSDTE